MFTYFRGDFVVCKLVYFVVSPHVAFATDVAHFCYSLRLSSAPAILTSRRAAVNVMTL